MPDLLITEFRQRLSLTACRDHGWCCFGGTKATIWPGAPRGGRDHQGGRYRRWRRERSMTKERSGPGSKVTNGRAGGPVGFSLRFARDVSHGRRSNTCLIWSNTRSIVAIMRWNALQEDSTPQGALFERGAVARTFDTPGFRGMTFYEVHARSIINQVPAASRMPFHWTINPYRGCGARLRLLLRPQDPHLPGPRRRAGLRLQDRRQGQRARAGPPRAGRAAVGGRARRDGHQRRLLPAGRGPVPADAAASSARCATRATRSRS